MAAIIYHVDESPFRWDAEKLLKAKMTLLDGKTKGNAVAQYINISYLHICMKSESASTLSYSVHILNLGLALLQFLRTTF